jgi:hypothetical protein
MPSVTHEAPIELIRQHPDLAVELLQAMSDVDLPSEIAVSLGPTDLSEVVPVKFLADAVVIVADKATGEPALVIIIEPQGRDDPTKEFSWPVYLTVVRRHLRCQRAFLLVICPDPDEAKKCRRVISTGHPGFDLAPEVIDPLNAPGVGSASPYLAIFAAYMGAMNLEGDQGARAFLTAVRESGASAADRKRLSTIMLNLASDAARRRLETMMTTVEWKSDFIEGFVQEGLQKGMQQGLQKGMQQGLQKGEVKAKSEDVLKVIDSRAINVTAEEREQVASCTDIAQLDEWFDSALTAETAADIFKS